MHFNPVDIFILFNNKIYLSIFWLENWWDVVKHPKYNFSARLVGFVGAGWQKSGLNFKTSRNLCFLPLGPSTKNVSPFLIITAKIRSLPRLFVKEVYYHLDWFKLYSPLKGRR